MTKEKKTEETKEETQKNLYPGGHRRLSNRVR